MERFEYQFSTTTTAPPTGSQVRLDNADPALATKLWVRNVTTPGEDVHPLLVSFPVGSRFWLQDYDDHTKFAAFQLTAAPVDMADYVELPVSSLGVGAPLLGQKVALDVVEPAAAPPGPSPGPSEPLPPLATPADLAALGVTGDPDDLNRLLDAASAAARAWCGWSISAQTAVDLPGRYAGKVVTLPTLWLTALHTVTVDGTAEGSLPGWLESGLLQLQVNAWAKVVANVDHGYDPIPADVSMAVAGMVSRVQSAPAGVSSERVGMWSVSYAAAALTVDPQAAMGLAPYRLPSVP
jgi:hypothetical protein